MRTLIFLLFIACSWMANAQTKIVGFVKLQSSGNQALPNAEVWAIGAASKPLRFSNTKGYFELEFPSKKAGDVIREVTVTLDGYEVVNKKDLESYGLLSQPRRQSAHHRALCKQGEYRKAAADYYQTTYHAGEAELQAEKKRLNKPWSKSAKTAAL
ncbi:MAG: carboxypeptidase regulatory-like domain-containing protein [Saprospiraceae bacterium]|nr:carboxypeptidase regulatory-like domain-containing protein [Saprospiraceae bacterium]